MVLGKPMNLFLREVSNIDESALLGHLAAKGVQMSAAGVYNSWLRSLGEAERDRILQALKEANGLIGGPTGAAARLGLPDDLAIPHEHSGWRSRWFGHVEERTNYILP
jgi:hypothetical protein